jgi:polysaccharide chain length determinant protein (PEP-CTERM system associated)
MDPFEITKYKDIAAKRKWWIVIPFLLTLLAGLAYVLVAPKIYEAETLILVQPQGVPEDFVHSIVSDTVEGRLKTITQQVTSRTNLERIIHEYGLYSSPETRMLLDEKVVLLRQNIKINVSHATRGRNTETNSFTITFRGKDPRKVMKVTNALASNFIEENLRSRESQALGTSEFLSDELEAVRKRLIKSEGELKQYREKYMGGLPEQLKTNLSILERQQGHLDQISSSLRDAENRRITIQTQITEQEREGERRQAAGQLPVQDEEGKDISTLRNELASLETRYTQNHPDVIRLKKTIAQLEAERSGSSIRTSPAGKPPAIPEEDQALRRQLQEVELEIKGYKDETKKIQSQISWYEKKVEETPKREQELLSLERDYENLKEQYNSILKRKLEAEIAVSMEKKQKGEQFRLIDEAIIPLRPVEPDMRKIMLLTLALGLGLGFGLAYVKEIMDTSFKTPEDVEEEFQLPVLVSMPIRYTLREVKSIKRKKVLAAVCVGVGFFLSAIGIVFALKGVDTTLIYVKKVFSGL